MYMNMDNKQKYKSLYLRVNFALFRDEHIRRLGANTIAIFMIIRTYANYDGIAYPSLATLSRKSGCGTRTVQGAIQKLVDYGWTEKEKRRSNEGKFSRGGRSRTFNGGFGDLCYAI